MQHWIGCDIQQACSTFLCCEWRRVRHGGDALPGLVRTNHSSGGWPDQRCTHGPAARPAQHPWHLGAAAIHTHHLTPVAAELPTAVHHTTGPRVSWLDLLPCLWIQEAWACFWYQSRSRRLCWSCACSSPTPLGSAKVPQHARNTPGAPVSAFLKTAWQAWDLDIMFKFNYCYFLNSSIVCFQAETFLCWW